AAVKRVERGLHVDGNSVTRYQVVWGTSRELTRVMIAAMHQAAGDGRLTLLNNHSITGIEQSGGVVTGASGINDKTGEPVEFQASTVVLATGGLNGRSEETRANWPQDRPMPATMLNGAHPLADGNLHHEVADKLGGHIVNRSEEHT